MEKIIIINKPVGLTPYQLIKLIKKKDKILKNLKIGYAGRLDPLAHGLLILLIGEENKNRQEYLNLNKEYEFSVLFGVGTDSYDYLGLITNYITNPIPNNLELEIKKFLKLNKGKIIQKYPPFSSKTINGVPLYKISKSTKINSILLPSREIKISKFDLISLENYPTPKIKETIFENISKVKGHFRQKKVLLAWERFFTTNSQKTHTIAKFKISCSSGTYIRSLANQLGEEIGCFAIAFEIKRTKVGRFNLSKAINH